MRRSRDTAGDTAAEAAERRLIRAVQAWAKKWERCPRQGCRRNRACVGPRPCLRDSPGPRDINERDRRRLARALRAWRAEEGNAGPAYDPDAREREAPLPPAPLRA